MGKYQICSDWRHVHCSWSQSRPRLGRASRILEHENQCGVPVIWMRNPHLLRKIVPACTWSARMLKSSNDLVQMEAVRPYSESFMSSIASVSDETCWSLLPILRNNTDQFTFWMPMMGPNDSSCIKSDKTLHYKQSIDLHDIHCCRRNLRIVSKDMDITSSPWFTLTRTWGATNAVPLKMLNTHLRHTTIDSRFCLWIQVFGYECFPARLHYDMISQLQYNL